MRFIYVILVLVSFNSWGQSSQGIYRQFPVLQCPKVGEEFEKMISKLESVKSAIRNNANCKNVELQVKSLEDLVVKDRQEVMDIVTKTQSESLTEEQSKKVRAYAENVTRKVAALNDLFMRTNQCFEEDNAGKQISTLAGFVSEASGLVGSLSGPWGAPIALAGNVIAGFLTGMDQILKSRAGYDFSKPDHWAGYVQNLCTYHSFRDQIDHLLDPQARIAKLKELKFKLELQISMFTSTCRECETIERTFNARVPGPPAETEMFTLNSEAETADRHFPKPVGSYTLQNLGLRQWTIREIARVEREAQTYWSDVTGRTLLYRAKEDIEQFLLAKEAPRFLNYQVGQSRKDYYNFQNFQSGTGRDLYNQLENLNPAALTRKVKFSGWTANDPLEMFRALVVSAVNVEVLPRTAAGEDVRFSLDYFRAQSMVRLRTAQTSAAVAQSFCSFFRHSGRYSPAIRSACMNPALSEVVATENQLESELRAANVQTEAARPLAVQPDFETSYSLNKVDALIRAIEFRSEGH